MCTKFNLPFAFMRGASSFTGPCPASCINVIMMSLMLCTQILVFKICLHSWQPIIRETSFEPLHAHALLISSLYQSFLWLNPNTTILSLTIHFENLKFSFLIRYLTLTERKRAPICFYQKEAQYQLSFSLTCLLNEES